MRVVRIISICMQRDNTCVMRVLSLKCNGVPLAAPEMPTRRVGNMRLLRD